MDLLQLRSGAKSYGSKLLFDEATFSVGLGEHIGVIGPNGAGKTTLFKILIGQEALDSGEVVASKQLRLGYLSQHDEWAADENVEDYLSKKAHLPIWTLKKLARGLGLDETHFSQKIAGLSGGYRMRVKLLSLIGQDPNLMLLDEPTNYLDLETLVVLENFLQGYEGAFLLISHDREFLRRTTSQTLEIESGEVTKFPGTIDDYFEEKALLREQLESRAQGLAEKRKQILDFVTRFGAKATKASQAQSRLKTLAKMESIELKPLPVRARIRIPSPTRAARIAFDLKAAEMGYKDRKVIEPINLRIATGDHIAVVGFNGVGKSTLLKTLARVIEPRAGEVHQGDRVTVGYYAQHVGEGLEMGQTVLEALESKAHPDVLPQQILDLAGGLLFGGDDVRKRISVLSGGERARVALGQILLQKSSCLLLDEPTNHLDFNTVEALTQALAEYPGTVITVSHDRGFIRRVGTKILEIDRGRLHLYPGTYDEYVWSVQNQVLRASGLIDSGPPAKNEVLQQEAAPPKSANADFRERKKALERELRQAEKAIQAVEPKIEELNAEIARLNQKASEISGNAAFDVIEKMNALQIELHALEEKWLTQNEKREALQAEIQSLAKVH